jgi:polyphosphate kinase 2 (PPK2 family)
VSKAKQKKREVVEAPDASGKIKRKEFEGELAKLQVELTRLQTWVKDQGARVIVVFEGRDTAGKGGVISRITARTSPRVFRHVALPAPSDRQRPKSTSNATSRNSQRRARSSSSTARGTIGPGSSE